MVCVCKCAPKHGDVSVPAKSKIRPTPPTAQQSGAIRSPELPPVALPIKKFAAAYGVHPSTVWRAVRDGRLAFIVIGKRKLILPPVAQKAVPQHTRLMPACRGI
jgi:hypothetical protein